MKEKKMANKRFWLGILVMALVFGMAVVGCDNDPTNDNGKGTGTQNPGGNNPGGTVNPFVGTWKASSGNQLVFNSNLTVNANWAPLASGTGTYTYTGNTARVTFGSVSENITISGNRFTFLTGTFIKQ